MDEKLIINVTYKCNNHCIFCAIADRSIAHGDFAQQKERIDQAFREGITALDIDGGEPTLYPRFFDLIDYAVEVGMQPITVTTNGRLLSDHALVEQLNKRPIRLLVSLHGGDASIHDSLTTQNGSFKQTVKGIMNAQPSFPDLGVNTTLVASNLHHLRKLGLLLERLGIHVWNLQYYTPFGEVKPELAPDPYEAGTVIVDLIEEFGSKIRIQAINLPACFMPGYESYALHDTGKSRRRMLFVDGREVNLGDWLAERRFKNAKCARCAHDNICQGFWDFGQDPQTGESSRVRMLDIIAGYSCSINCRYCAVEDHLLPHNMTTQQVLDQIDRAMAFGPHVIRFGGGEPTERSDLEELIRYSKALDFETISVQTHGFRLADSDYLQALVTSGVNKFNISVRGADPETHDFLTGSLGSFASLTQAVANVAELSPQVKLELDVILTRQTVPTLTRHIQLFSGFGASAFNFWFVTAEGRARQHWDELAPNMTEAAQAVKQAAVFAEAKGLGPIRCYYIPYCFFKGQEQLVWHPLEENALVVTPTSTFTLDKGTLDLGVKAEPCQSCSRIDSCFGIAPSYLEYAGDKELKPY